jgi:hypothetical protein
MTSETPTFSINALQELIAHSDAYKALTPAEQQNIQDHIRLNNTPVLIFVYEKLLEEQQSYQISRDRLAQKVANLTISPEDLQSLHQDLGKSFQK